MQPWNVSLPAAAAAQAAAAETDFAAETARLTAENRREMRQWMEEAGYRVFDSGTNFLLFIGAPGLGNYCAEQGFLIRDCSNFPGLEPDRGEVSDGAAVQGEKEVFYRICVRGSRENAALMEILRKFNREQL